MDPNFKLIEGGEFFLHMFTYVASDALGSTKRYRRHTNLYMYIPKSVKKVVLWKDGLGTWQLE